MSQLDLDELERRCKARLIDADDPAVLDLIERVRAAEGALDEIRRIEKQPDDEHDEYGFNNCHIEGYNDGLEVCQAIVRRAAALHTEGGESNGRPTEKVDPDSIEWKDGETKRWVGNTLVYRSYEDYCDD